MTTTMFKTLIDQAKAAFKARPAPVPVAPAPVYQQTSTTGIPSAAIAISPYPNATRFTDQQLGQTIPVRPTAVEDIRLGFAFGMQEVRIGLHATGEAPGKIASLVNGR